MWGCTSLPELEEDGVCKCFNFSALRNATAVLICCVTSLCLQSITPSPACDSFCAEWKTLAKRSVFSPPPWHLPGLCYLFAEHPLRCSGGRVLLNLSVGMLRRYRCARRSHQTFEKPLKMSLGEGLAKQTLSGGSAFWCIRCLDVGNHMHRVPEDVHAMDLGYQLLCTSARRCLESKPHP